MQVRSKDLLRDLKLKWTMANSILNCTVHLLIEKARTWVRTDSKETLAFRFTEKTMF